MPAQLEPRVYHVRHERRAVSKNSPPSSIVKQYNNRRTDNFPVSALKEDDSAMLSKSTFLGILLILLRKLFLVKQISRLPFLVDKALCFVFSPSQNSRRINLQGISTRWCFFHSNFSEYSRSPLFKYNRESASSSAVWKSATLIIELGGALKFSFFGRL